MSEIPSLEYNAIPQEIRRLEGLLVAAEGEYAQREKEFFDYIADTAGDYHDDVTQRAQELESQMKAAENAMVRLRASIDQLIAVSSKNNTGGDPQAKGSA